MASTISSLAEVFLIDSRAGPGAFQFPDTATYDGRKITIKDAYGTFGTSKVQLYLSSIDTFEDGSKYKFVSTNNASMSFFATSNKWYSYSSNTSGGYSKDKTGFNCNAPQYGLDINGVANFSTITGIKISPSQSNLWVAVGAGTYSILNSVDGINWAQATDQANGFSLSGNCVEFGGNMWVAGGSDLTASNQLKYSYDGKTWSNVLTNAFDYVNSGCQALAWNGRMWVAVGGASTSNGTIKYSYDGKVWSNANQGFSDDTGAGYLGMGVGWSGTMWVAGGFYGGTSPLTKSMLYSYDGINWIESATIENSGNTASGAVGKIAWDGHRWIAAFLTNSGFVKDVLKYSSDGKIWYNGSFSNTTHLITGVLYTGRGYLFSAWDNTNSLFYSQDGYTNFGSIYTGNGTGFSALPPVYNGTMFVYTQRTTQDSNYTIVYSYDGFTWNPSSGVLFPGNSSLGGLAVAYSSNGPVYNQKNFQIYENSIWSPLVSTNNFYCMPTSILMNNTLRVDKEFNNVQINAPSQMYSPFTLDVNGPARYALLPSTISAGGTLTITPGEGLGLSYNVTASGNYTIALASTQSPFNIGKFYQFRNNSGTNMRVTISGGSGITSPMSFSTNITRTIVVATTGSYALF